MSAFWEQDARRQGAAAFAVLPGRAACVAWRGTSNNALCAMDTRRRRWPVAVLSSSRHREQALLFLPWFASFPARCRVAMAGGRQNRAIRGGTVFHLPSTPWVPEIRPINISRSKMKQGLTWYRLQRLRTALSRHGCAPLASPPPRIELCALELICRDHARDAGTLRH